MKPMLIIVLTILSVTVFAGNPYDLSREDPSSVKFDYNLTDSTEKRAKLKEMVKYEDYIMRRLHEENEKFDQLVSQLASTKSKSASFRRLQQDAHRQHRVTLRLLNQADAISNYIQWLRS